MSDCFLSCSEEDDCVFQQVQRKVRGGEGVQRHRVLTGPFGHLIRIVSFRGEYRDPEASPVAIPTRRPPCGRPSLRVKEEERVPEALSVAPPTRCPPNGRPSSRGLMSIYRVSHIKCSTARHERGCAACPRREQSNSKKIGCS
jgi:hypothetical protein